MVDASSLDRKRRIAILGGGAGGLAAAYTIVNSDGYRPEDFQIDVYQIGWRLGGKGASGRDATAGRNYEHGLHVFAGFYHNTMRMMEGCYALWQQMRREGSYPIDFSTAFQQVGNDEINCTLMEMTGSAGWQPIDISLPNNVTLFPKSVRPPDLIPEDLMLRLLVFAQHSILGWSKFPQQGGKSVLRELFDRVATSLRVLATGRAAGFAFPLPRPPRIAVRSIAKMLRGMLELSLRIEPSVRPVGRGHHQFLIGMVALVCLIGILDDDLFGQGFDSINDQDLDDWLKRHGASREVLESPYVRAGFDYAFAYSNGVTVPRPHRSIAAGVALRAFLRLLLTYEDSLFVNLGGGTGEVVFMPLYEVLKRKGVKFHFFHQVDELVVDDRAERVTSIHMTVQAETISGEPYEPRIYINTGNSPQTQKSRACWPTEPLYDQLVDGDALAAGHRAGQSLEWAEPTTRAPRKPSKKLFVGKDFDEVVLAIPVGALDRICGPLRENRNLPQWGKMLDSARTISTVSAQLWLNLPFEIPSGQASLVTAYAQPFATVANMSFLLQYEVAPAAPTEPLPKPGSATSIAIGSKPNFLTYLCGAWEEEIAPKRTLAVRQKQENDRASKMAKVWISKYLHKLIGGDPVQTGMLGAGALEVHVNLDPSGRYVASPPGSIQHRLRPNGSGVSNLFLAGDWTRNGLDAGAFEAAVMSGMQAARAILDDPSIIVAGETDPRW